MKNTDLNKVLGRRSFRIKQVFNYVSQGSVTYKEILTVRDFTGKK